MEKLNNIEGFPSSLSKRDRDSELGNNPTFDTIKGKVAQGLKSAAASLEQKAPQNGEVSGYVKGASRWLDNAGGYVEDLNLSQVKRDIQGQMRANPGRSLLIAGAVGLIVGTLFRRR